MSSSALTPRQIQLLPFPQFVAAVTPPAACPRAGTCTWAEARQYGLFRGGAPAAAAHRAAANPEGYAVYLDRSGPAPRRLLVGDTSRAIRHARVTADQLRRNTAPARLPRRLLIVDWPDVPVRMAMRTLMCTRPDAGRWYFEQGLRDYRDIFRRMVDLKLNTFVLHSAWGYGLADLLPDGQHVDPFVRELIREARGRGLDLVLLMSHSLEVGMRHAGLGGKRSYPCGADPRIRARRLRAFAALVRRFPEVKFWMVHNEEHPKCTCARCRKTTIGDEFLAYLRAYRRILRRLRPDAQFIAVPFYQLGWPAFHLDYLNGRWREIDADVRTAWWTDNYPRRPLPQFLTDVNECFEPVVWHKVPRAWHWFYMNGWTDFTFPCPDHFRSWVRAARQTGHLEGVSGEQAFYRGSEWNVRALAQYGWNAELPADAFDTLMLRADFGPAGPTTHRRIVTGYRAALADFLRALFTAGQRWHEPGTPEVIRTLRTVVRRAAALEARLRALSPHDTTRPPGDPAADLLLDVSILRHEAQVRLLLRDAHQMWQAAEQHYDTGRMREGAVALRRSMAFIRAAQTAWEQQRAARRARGNYHDDFQAAPMPRMERVFPDLIATTQQTLDLRRQGFRGYRPRYREWLEVDLLWRGYVAFH